MPRGRASVVSERLQTIKEARKTASDSLKSLRAELKKDPNHCS